VAAGEKGYRDAGEQGYRDTVSCPEIGLH